MAIENVNDVAKIKYFMENHSIECQITQVAISPSVVTYGITPINSTKVSSILRLENDLSLSLHSRVRMWVSPEDGYIVLEAPRENVETVLFDDIANKILSKNNLNIPIGIDTRGRLFSADIATMPHLLIAGATGAGKSVLVHSILSYLISTNSVNSLRLVLIDPKRVELIVYENIPHLDIPVQTDTKSSIVYLGGVVKLMEKRYQILEKARVRNISEYNEINSPKMPNVLVIIDELADLMITSKRQVESLIIRLAQMARAVGIHLIVTTQRPSTDIITGLIKANFPTRVALSTVSRVDSRVILDKGGAECLLGRGDMLYTSSQLRSPVRLQGAYVDSQVIQRICEKATHENNNEIRVWKEPYQDFIREYLKIQIKNETEKIDEKIEKVSDKLNKAKWEYDNLLSEEKRCKSLMGIGLAESLLSKRRSLKLITKTYHKFESVKDKLKEAQFNCQVLYERYQNLLVERETIIENLKSDFRNIVPDL